MPVAYPLGLRTIIQATKRRSNPPAFRALQPRRGLGYNQTIGTEPPVVWDVAFRFTTDEAQVFRLWFERDLQQGVEEFTLPIRTEFGEVEYTCRFLPDSLLQTTEIGEVWEFGASILARAQVVPGSAPSSSGLTTAWPDALPSILRASKRRRRDASFAASDAAGGYAHFEAAGTDQPVVWDAEVRFTPAQAALFQVWFRDVLDLGVQPFTASIRTEFGLIEHECQFLPSGLLETTEEGETWRYRMSFAARSLYAPPLDSDPYWIDALVGDPHWAETVLLLHLDGSNGGTTFTDSSAETESIGATGGATLSTTQKKFGTTSVALDGSTQYLSAGAANTNYDFGSGEFTVEAWIYSTEAGRRQQIVGQSTGSNGWRLFKDSSNRLAFERYLSGSGQSTHSGSVTIAMNTWTHVAVSRSAAPGTMQIRLFINGVDVEGFITGTTSIGGSSAVLRIGSDGATAGREFAGYIDEVRITKGVGRYWGHFNLPTDAHPDFLDAAYTETSPRTAMLLHAEDTSDAVLWQPKTVTLGGSAAVSSSAFKFGANAFSMTNPGSSVGNVVAVAPHQDFIMGGLDFTIEIWARRAANTNVGFLWSGLAAGASSFASVGTDGLLDAQVRSSAGTNYTLSNIATIPVGAWVFYVFQRRGTVFEVFVDGVLVGSISVGSANFVQDTAFGFLLGKPTTSNSSTTWNGQIDEVRVTRGVARYTAGFTPPEAAFPEL